MDKTIAITKASIMLGALSLAAFWCLNTTLNDMTRADCQAGIQAACKALK